MQHVDIRTRVLERGSTSTSDGTWTAAALTAAINQALQRFNAEADWFWTEGVDRSFTVDNTDGRVTLPTNYMKLHKVLRTATSAELVVGPLELVELMNGQHAATATPLMYARIGTELIVGPKPTATLAVTIMFKKREATLSADADQPNVPTEFTDPVIEYATYLMFARERQLPLAQRAHDAYTQWVDRLKADLIGAPAEAG